MFLCEDIDARHRLLDKSAVQEELGELPVVPQVHLLMGLNPLSRKEENKVETGLGKEERSLSVLCVHAQDSAVPAPQGHGA